MKYRNNIELSGYISKVNTDSDKCVWINIAQNNNFKTKEGIDVETTSFFNARLFKDMYEENKNILEIGKPIIISGALRVYFDKLNNKVSFIQVFGIKEVKQTNDESNE